MSAGTGQPAVATRLQRIPFGDREARLLAAAQGGDCRAWNDLATLYWDEVHQVCFFELRQQEDAEDACIETFLRAQKGLLTFMPGRPFGAWLTTIARNACRDERRKQRRRDEKVQILSVGGAGREDMMFFDFLTRREALEQFRREEDISALFTGLDLGEREMTLVMMVVEEMPAEAIAEELAISSDEAASAARTATTALASIRSMTKQARADEQERIAWAKESWREHWSDDYVRRCYSDEGLRSARNEDLKRRVHQARNGARQRWLNRVGKTFRAKLLSALPRSR